MPVRESYAPGTPSWIDLMSPDVDASAAFYTALFGWETDDQFDDEGNRIYTMFRVDGRDVAGAGGQPPGMEDMPPVWSSYVAVEDVDAAVARVEAAGGKVMMGSMDVMDAGRMAVVADPAGAAISLWQANQHIGAQLIHEPGALSWNELITRDPNGVRDFYSQAFGWELTDQDMGPMGTYTVATLDGEQVAGIMQMPAEFPDRVPNHWMVYFHVADIDATLAKAKELGGSVVSGPMAAPGVGRFAAIHDPHNGTFSVLQPEEG